MPSDKRRLFPTGDKLVDVSAIVLVASGVCALVLFALTVFRQANAPEGSPLDNVLDNVQRDAEIPPPPSPGIARAQRLVRSVQAAPESTAIAIDPGEYPGAMRIDKAIEIHTIAGIARIGTAYSEDDRALLESRISPSLGARLE